jgi:hypothetical protein
MPLVEGVERDGRHCVARGERLMMAHARLRREEPLTLGDVGNVAEEQRPPGARSVRDRSMN